MSHEFSGVLQTFYFGILFKHLVQLINGVGNAGIEIFTDIRIPFNKARKKEKERERLICDKIKYKMRNQFVGLVCDSITRTNHTQELGRCALPR